MNKYLFWSVILIAVILGLIWFFNLTPKEKQKKETISLGDFTFSSSVERLVPLDKILNGGPGKDGIPALTSPEFVSISEISFPGDTLGVLISFNGETRYYPYNILLWHEVVNDNIGDNFFAVTFCPLCGSAIVFNREVGGEVLEFGVSGLLFESNLIMYDKKTESLWSQVRGESIVGELAGEKLEVLVMQLIEFSKLKAEFPNTKVLSKNTGFNRNYEYNPYGDYDESDAIYFPISVKDDRFPLKEVMYVIPFKDKSIAVQQLELEDGQTEEMEVDDSIIYLRRNGSEIVAQTDGKVLPGYYEMWFSWAIHHQDNGIVWPLD